MVKAFKIGQRIDAFFVLRKIKLRTHKERGEPYLSLELGDASGRIFGTLWHHIQSMKNTLHEGELVKVKAKVIDWKGKPHLAIDKVRLATEADAILLEDYIPKSEAGPDDLYTQLLTIANGLTAPEYSELLNGILTDPTIKSKLLTAPAGKLWHHCYRGGLLEHTLGVVRLVKTVAALYPQVDVDLLVTAAILHDMGKLDELTDGPVIDYTDAGRLLGHIAMGHHLVAGRIDAMPHFPEEKKHQLLHLILSHQGQLEHGSPVVPMTREAFILHFADELDSKMNAFERVYNKEKQQHKKWSSWVKLLERYFYFGPDNQKQ